MGHNADMVRGVLSGGYFSLGREPIAVLSSLRSIALPGNKEDSMLLTLFAVVGFAVVALALLLNAARGAAKRRQAQKRTAELIRLRLQEEPSVRRVAYRKIEILLSRS